MSSPLKTCWANPWVRRPLFVALAFAVVFAVCWVIIDRLGKDAWGSFEKRLVAEGETLDFPVLLSPPAPEEENFCAIPPLRNLGTAGTDRSAAGEEGLANRARIKEMNPRSGTLNACYMHGLFRGTPLDFAQIAKGMRTEGSWPMPAVPGDPAHDVVAGLGKWDPYVAELAAGLSRPRAQWMPALSRGKLQQPYLVATYPHFSSVYTLGRNLSLRAAAAGAAGDLPKAIESLRLAQRLSAASYDDPTLVNALLGASLDTLAVGAVWEICRLRPGTAEEWVQLEQVMTREEPPAAFLRCYRGELAAGLDTILWTRETRERDGMVMLLPGVYDFPPRDYRAADEVALTAMHFAPPGFFDAVATEYGSDPLKYLIMPLRDEGWPSFVPSLHAFEAKLRGPGNVWNLASMAARPSLENFARSMVSGVHLQVILNQAAIACVLEHTRLVSGSYPASLEGLTLTDARPLPVDACTGQPMHYRPTPEGRYVLWSNGPDGRDDHASRALSFHAPTEPDYVGDWVWGYSATP